MTELRQMTLDEIRRARRSDPATSKDAARRAQRLAGEHAQKILAVLRAADQPLDARQIAARCDLDALQVGRRMHELCSPDLAAAVVVDKLGSTDAGRAAQRWRIA